MIKLVSVIARSAVCDEAMTDTSLIINEMRNSYGND